MYDIGVALRRFKGLISYTARKYSIQGHFRLSTQDIEAEGLLTLVQCCRKFPPGQVRFAAYFKRAWNNRLKKLARFGMQAKRRGFEVDLELAESLPAPTQEVWERILDRAELVAPLLSAETRRFLQQLLEPSEEVMEYAWRDFCRKQKLKSQGVSVPGCERFRIKLRHVRGALRMSPLQVYKAVDEIRLASSQIRRRELHD